MDSQQLRQTGEDYLIRSSLLSDVVAASGGPVFVRAEGSQVWDRDGKSYLDFNSGQMCSWLGHNNPRVTEAVRHGLTQLTHASSVYYNEPQVMLAKKLAETLDAPLSRSLFIQSGADSNEAAILFARRATGKNGIAALHLSFHGYSDVSRAMSYIAAAPNHGPTIPDLYAIPTPYAYRSPIESEGDAWWQALLDISFDTLDRQCAGNLAAVIVEPLVSAGGVIELPSAYVRALKERLEARGALLIFDEAQTGLGKLGAMYAYQQCDVMPDIITVSKHFGGGMAISAMVTSDEIEQKALEGGLSFGHSHSSDPIGCTAGLASLEVIMEEDVAARAAAIGSYWQARMRDLQQRYEIIGDVRGRGCLQGIELVRERAGKEPAAKEADEIFRLCIADGLLFSVRGAHGNVVRFVPPVTTSENQIDQATDILESALRKVV
ncbi:MAG: aspartate aminotransferase family protein [Alphaproteobacteria bacterium]|jgi:2,2-dialkylglycine decarboxylase (pyruvate)|nr:aspartate aminotransferase family protein [Rhodospirillales bacterium]MDP6588508.1 aspartate aminotransferase family protein [Alphaproteobacteria bacterium]MDP6819103.1 aspartate aminotransferase family protein [Alphaproteobacteria bacterium]